MPTARHWGQALYPQGSAVGVAKIDASERVDVVSPVERAIDELLKLELDLAGSALGRPTDKSEFGYGHVCGMFQAFRMARSLLEHCLNEGDPARERHGES